MAFPPPSSKEKHIPKLTHMPDHVFAVLSYHLLTPPQPQFASSDSSSSSSVLPDYATLSRLSRTCKTIKNKTEEFLWREVVWRNGYRWGWIFRNVGESEGGTGLRHVRQMTIHVHEWDSTQKKDWNVIAKCPNLKNLHLTASDSPPNNPLLFLPTTNHVFPHLEKLCINVMYIDPDRAYFAISQKKKSPGPQITPSPTYFPSTFPVLHDLSYSGAKKDLRGLIRQAESRPTRYAFNQDGTDRAGKKNEIPFPTVRKASLKHYGPCGFLSTMVVWQMGVENVEEIEVGSCGQVPMDNKSWNRMILHELSDLHSAKKITLCIARWKHCLDFGSIWCAGPRYGPNEGKENFLSGGMQAVYNDDRGVENARALAARLKKLERFCIVDGRAQTIFGLDDRSTILRPTRPLCAGMQIDERDRNPATILDLTFTRVPNQFLPDVDWEVQKEGAFGLGGPGHSPQPVAIMSNWPLEPMSLFFGSHMQVMGAGEFEDSDF